MKTLHPVSQETYERIGKAYLICSQYPEVFEGVSYKKFCGMFVDDIIDEGEDIIEARKKAAAPEMYEMLELAVESLIKHNTDRHTVGMIEALLDRIDYGEEGSSDGE